MTVKPAQDINNQQQGRDMKNHQIKPVGQRAFIEKLQCVATEDQDDRYGKGVQNNDAFQAHLEFSAPTWSKSALSGVDSFNYPVKAWPTQMLRKIECYSLIIRPYLPDVNYLRFPRFEGIWPEKHRPDSAVPRSQHFLALSVQNEAPCVCGMINI